SRRRHTRSDRDWSSDVCSSDLWEGLAPVPGNTTGFSVVLDSTSGTAVMFGGRVPGSYEPTGDVWSFDLHTGQWSPFPYQAAPSRSEERRVGKECRATWWSDRHE